MDQGHLLQIIQPMLAGSKLEIAKMRSEVPPRLKLIECSMSSKRSMRLTTMRKVSSLWRFSGKLPGSRASGTRRDSRRPHHSVFAGKQQTRRPVARPLAITQNRNH